MKLITSLMLVLFSTQVLAELYIGDHKKVSGIAQQTPRYLTAILPVFADADSVSNNPNNGSQLTETYIYNKITNGNPNQLKSITYSNGSSVNLEYNPQGNAESYTRSIKQADGSVKTYGQTIEYDPIDNVTQIQQKNGDVSRAIHYQYDNNGKQFEAYSNNIQNSTTNNVETVKLTQQQIITLLNGQTIKSPREIISNTNTRYYSSKGSVFAGEYTSKVTDGYSVTGQYNKAQQLHDQKLYTPFGYASDLSSVAKVMADDMRNASNDNGHIGYRGMPIDQFTDNQILGGGYREYNPVLRVFMKHDSASPIGKGGLNAYAYAQNDPINGFDPSGHMYQGDVNYSLDIGGQNIYSEGGAEGGSVFGELLGGEADIEDMIDIARVVFDVFNLEDGEGEADLVGSSTIKQETESKPLTLMQRKKLELSKGINFKRSVQKVKINSLMSADKNALREWDGNFGKFFSELKSSNRDIESDMGNKKYYAPEENDIHRDFSDINNGRLYKYVINDEGGPLLAEVRGLEEGQNISHAAIAKYNNVYHAGTILRDEDKVYLTTSSGHYQFKEAEESFYRGVIDKFSQQGLKINEVHLIHTTDFPSGLLSSNVINGWRKDVSNSVKSYKIKLMSNNWKYF